MTTFLRRSIIVPVQSLLNENEIDDNFRRELQSSNHQFVQFNQLIPIQALLPVHINPETQKEMNKIETFYKLCKLYTFLKMFNLH